MEHHMSHLENNQKLDDPNDEDTKPTKKKKPQGLGGLKINAPIITISGPQDAQGSSSEEEAMDLSKPVPVTPIQRLGMKLGLSISAGDSGNNLFQKSLPRTPLKHSNVNKKYRCLSCVPICPTQMLQNLLL